MPTVSAPAQIDQEQAILAWNMICRANSIGIISHRRPDPDSVGSNLALRQALFSLGKTVDSLCVDEPPQNCRFLNGALQYTSNLIPEKYDLLISVDCGSIDQVSFGKNNPEIFDENFLNIDHHASNNNFGTVNLVYTQLSSTSEIIYLLFKFWQIPITSAIATCLICGLYYDTGSFTHSNTSPRVMEIASDLMRLGADLPKVIDHLYRNFTKEKFHLWGQSLEKIKVTDRGTSVAVITQDEFTRTSSTQEDLSGLIDYVSMVKDSEFAVLISQENSNQIKGSLRTRKDNINLSNMAEKMGGGGHRKASGFGFTGKITKQVTWKITTPR